MVTIVEGKQVGTLYHLTTELSNLCSILQYEELWSSKAPEKNIQRKQDMYYVSFGRDLSAASRCESRWNCGVVIDGTKLSDRYSITPYSWAGNMLTHASRLRVKYIMQYDDGQCLVHCIKWGSFPVSKQLYDEIKAEMFKQADKLNDEYGFYEMGPSTRPYGGHRREEGYGYKSKYGGLVISSKWLSDISLVSKNDRFNEKEERIWLPSRDNTVNISGCIQGVVIKKSVWDSLDWESPLYEWLDDQASSVLGENWQQTALKLI